MEATLRVMVDVCDPADAAVLAELGEATFRETYAPLTSANQMHAHVANAFRVERMAAELTAEGSTWLLARCDGMPAGFMKTNEWRTPGPAGESAGLEIENLYVLRRFQGLGIGARLLDIAVEQAEERGLPSVWIQVWERNEPGYRFWAGQGFREAGTRPFHFAGETHRDVVMLRELEPDDQ
jgi:diamine N-acetyltransferase